MGIISVGFPRATEGKSWRELVSDYFIEEKSLEHLTAVGSISGTPVRKKRITRLIRNSEY